MFFDFWNEEEYTDRMIQEAIRIPDSTQPIPGFIWSSYVSNLQIMLWALKNHWSCTDMGEKIDVEGYAKKLYSTHQHPYKDSPQEIYINALRDPKYTNKLYDEAIRTKVKQVTNVHGYAPTSAVAATGDHVKDVDLVETALDCITNPDNFMFIASGALVLYGAYINFCNQDSE